MPALISYRHIELPRDGHPSRLSWHPPLSSMSWWGSGWASHQDHWFVGGKLMYNQFIPPERRLDYFPPFLPLVTISGLNSASSSSSITPSVTAPPPSGGFSFVKRGVLSKNVRKAREIFLSHAPFDRRWRVQCSLLSSRAGKRPEFAQNTVVGEL